MIVFLYIISLLTLQSPQNFTGTIKYDRLASNGHHTHWIYYFGDHKLRIDYVDPITDSILYSSVYILNEPNYTYKKTEDGFNKSYFEPTTINSVDSVGLADVEILDYSCNQIVVNHEPFLEFERPIYIKQQKFYTIDLKYSFPDE